MSNRLAAIVLPANLLYLFLLPSRTGKAVAFVGCIVTVTLIASFGRSAGAGGEQRAITLDRLWSVILLALFALPLASFLGQPQIAFWRLDGRGLLILAWLGALAVLIGASVDARPGTASRQRLVRPILLTQLFVVWSAIFWMTVIWDLGIARAVLGVQHDDRLTSSFALWTVERARDHLFMVWLNREAFEAGVAYSNHLHPITFFFYGCSRLVQLATGMPLYVGRNLAPFVMAALGVIAFTMLLPRMARSPRGTATFHITLFLVLGYFLSEWHFWVFPYTWNFDTVFPIIVYLAALVWAAATPRIRAANAWRLTLALMILGAFGWIYTPLLILALWFLFSEPKHGIAATLAANRTLVRASVAGMAVAVVTYAIPLVLIAIRGYRNSSSPFLFRSGLDGDMRYFQDVGQAVFHPVNGARSWISVIFPGAVLLTIAACCAWRDGVVTRRRLGRACLFLLVPYGFSVALFPQSVSIHPYMYDTLLILPMVLLGSLGVLAPSVQRRLRGGTTLAGLLLIAILIMANLIAISQGVVRLLRPAA
ncbi:MAG: hypothetical protein ABIS06_20515 [Vicinamibacterales bacterium]